MIQTKGYAALSATSPLQPFTFERRDPKPDDVVIEIAYTGICHSDIHTVRSQWGPTAYPCVPGHEIVGIVKAVGKNVKKLKVGDVAGVGCFVDSCGKCTGCKKYEEQFCANHTVFTYNGVELDNKTPTFGGYASSIVVKEKYVLKIKKGHKVGIVGLGGLGHMTVKLAKSMGAEVTIFSTSPNKEVDAKKLGAKYFVLSKNPANFEKLAGKFDFIFDTVL